MPSPIAHALAGMAIAGAADLAARGRSGPLAPFVSSSHLAVACVCLAVVPDVDLLLPITHRTVTHSLAAVGIVGLFLIIVAVVTGQVTARIAVACVAAYASHLLIDWLQTDPTPPHGIQLLWPFSSAWFVSGWNVFRATERHHVFEPATMKRNIVAVMQEIALLAPVVLAVWLVRVKAAARLAAQMSGGNHPPK